MLYTPYDILTVACDNCGEYIVHRMPNSPQNITVPQLRDILWDMYQRGDRATLRQLLQGLPYDATKTVYANDTITYFAQSYKVSEEDVKKSFGDIVGSILGGVGGTDINVASAQPPKQNSTVLWISVAIVVITIVIVLVGNNKKN